MYKIINSFFSKENRKNRILIQTPNRSSFGNCAEEMYFGLLKAKINNKRALFLYPRMKIFSLQLSVANRELYHLCSPYIANVPFSHWLGGQIISLYTIILWIFDWFRRIKIIRKVGRFFNSDMTEKAQKNFGYVVPTIGRVDIWKQYGENSFSWKAVDNLDWSSQINNYNPPRLSNIKYNSSLQKRIDLGIPLSDWFVCLHVSENDTTTVRNASIENYIKGIKAITKRGGWVVRLGSPSMKSLPIMEKVIDYGHSIHKSPSMDLYLISECEFFIGLASGPTFVAALFDKPQVQVNMTDYTLGLPLKKGSLGIMKHVFSRTQNRFLSIREVLNEPFAVTAFDESISDEYIFVENSDEEIYNLIEEFMNRRNNFNYSENQLAYNEARKEAIRRMINDGEPEWDGIPPHEKYNSQFRIASRVEAKGTLGEKFLAQNLEMDMYESSGFSIDFIKDQKSLIVI
tara:strand:- start:36 stop:1409 length:1374 start_codon:yes stop_codon:yes gene_type:complete